MRILKSRFRSGTDFLANVLGQSEYGGLFFPTREAVPIGESLLIEVAFPELADKMLMRGFVAWRRPGRHRQKIRAGIGIEFLPTERSKLDYLLASAQSSDSAASQRRHKRLPTSLDVAWRIKEDRDTQPATLDDIGPGGAYLRTDAPAPEGTSVVLELLPPGGQVPLSIEGRIAWHDARGAGVEFRVRDTGGIRRIKEIVRRLETAA